ncbi:TPA: hypothetical protein NNM78_001908 [Pseudomonas aeruginosa]|nr:hypothetical protein [Pseudomonas aeruginosa]
MKSSEQSFKNAANAIFAKFVVKLASTEPVTAAVITAAAGGLILAAGGYQELADTTTLLSQAGPDALAAYQATTPKTITQLLGRALAGDLPSRGLATMGTGIWTVLTAPPVAYAVAKFAKGLDFVKEMAEKVERAERPRGATRLAADLDAIDNHYRQPENKGPSPRGLR